MRKYIASIMILFSIFNLASCGYLLYPGRIDQQSGKIDPTVVILDAAGLLFGVLPGVVAFAVDIVTGTIYLSPNEESAIEKHKKSFTMAEDLSLESISQDQIMHETMIHTLIDTAHVAEEISTLIGQPVNEKNITYFKPDNTGPIILSLDKRHHNVL